MLFQNKIKQYLEEIKELESLYLETQDKEILPLSFFNTSINILNRLEAGIYEVVSMQLEMMQNQSKEFEKKCCIINETDVSEEFPKINRIDEKAASVVNILTDTVGRKVNPDFGKSLSLNDRFMFQRDLFHNNVEEMNQTFDQLNALQSLDDALSFLDKTYTIDWDSDWGIALRDLLDKRFA